MDRQSIVVLWIYAASARSLARAHLRAHQVPRSGAAQSITFLTGIAFGVTIIKCAIHPETMFFNGFASSPISVRPLLRARFPTLAVSTVSGLAGDAAARGIRQFFRI